MLLFRWNMVELSRSGLAVFGRTASPAADIELRETIFRRLRGAEVHIPVVAPPGGLLGRGLGPEVADPFSPCRSGRMPLPYNAARILPIFARTEREVGSIFATG